MNVTVLVDSRLRGNDSEAHELIPISITGRTTSHEENAGFVCPACFMRSCDLKQHFSFCGFVLTPALVWIIV